MIKRQYYSSEKVKFEAIQNSVDAIEYIVNPSEKVKMEAIKNIVDA